ncbi:MAG TPA: hypothetical protein ENN66_09110 [Proteobacteria bacterium]|nr:hypothetical protein [Pseudomonadota bacterium]
MHSFFVYNNGRLKTGRVSLVFFLVFIGVCGLLFQLHRPVDEAVVIVRHLFTPEKMAAERAPVALKKKGSPVETQAFEPEADLPTEAQSDPLPPTGKIEKTESKDLVATAALAAPEVKPESKGEDTSLFVAGEELVGETENQVETESSAVLSQDDVLDPEPEILENKAEIVTDLHSRNHVAADSGKTAVQLLSESDRQQLRSYAESLVKKNFPTLQEDELQKIRSSQDQVSPKTAEKDTNSMNMEKQPLSSLTKKTKMTKTTVLPKLKLDRNKYTQLHQAWRKEGEKERSPQQIIPLRIENLRESYSFLQMKAVALLKDGRCLDLDDGSLIPAASLESFSSTVIEVDNPWQKWGPELKRAGLYPEQISAVRYYLYDFVKRAIYTRVNQAFTWSLEKGLLKAGVKPEEVDVLGRTFVLEGPGGGAFGVFVPLSLATHDGRSIELDPCSFCNAPDLAALHAAGLI